MLLFGLQFVGGAKQQQQQQKNRNISSDQYDVILSGNNCQF
jgi:hypothetical protein